MWEFWFVLALLLTIAIIWTNNSMLYLPLFSTLFTGFMSLINHHLSQQFLCFLLFVLLLTRLKPFFCLEPSILPPKQTSLDHLMGHYGVVTQYIGPSPLDSGFIKIDGEQWCALSYTHTPIMPGKIIKVKAINGLHVFVTTVK